MKAKACDVCERPLAERVTTPAAPYLYVLGGLPRIGLSGIVVYRCVECGVDLPVIPKPGQLHRALADFFVRKPGLLAGDELRFLRKYAGLSAQTFAARLGINPSHLSRVETGKHASLHASTDRLARAIVLAAIGSNDVRELLSRDVAEQARPLRRPLAKMEGNRWKVAA